MDEPGLDRAEWETEWAALEPLVVDSPEEALPEVDRLVRSMLVEVGYPLEEGEVERMAAQGIDPDVLATYLAAHEIVTRPEKFFSFSVPPGDSGAVRLTRSVSRSAASMTTQADERRRTGRARAAYRMEPWTGIGISEFRFQNSDFKTPSPAFLYR